MYVARPEQSLVYLYSFGLILLATEAFFELNLEYFRSNLMPVKYSLAFFFKAVLALGLGVILALSRFGALGMIVGIIVADVIAVLVFSRLFSMKLITGIRHFSVQHCKSLFLYGLPLSASFAMAFIVNSSDRFFINHYLGPASTGIYAVAYDFSNNSLSVIMYAINLASFPLAIRALEKGGEVLAREQLEKNLILLLSITIPVAVGMAIMSSEISSIFIGQAYSKDASIIIPLVAIGGLFIGFKNYYLDLAFQLGNKTYLQIWAVAFSAIVNILLNIFWIPKYGIIGAVYSTLACYIVSIAFSYKMSQRSFEMPMPFMKIIKIIISAVVMSMFIFILKPYFVDIYGFIVLVLAGGGIYVCCLIASKILDHNYLLLLGQRFLHKSSGK
jgi:O-antigen/teichoic acid export membrane protein